MHGAVLPNGRAPLPRFAGDVCPGCRRLSSE